MSQSVYKTGGPLTAPAADDLLCNWTTHPSEPGRVSAVVSTVGTDGIWVAFYGNGSGMPLVFVKNGTIEIDLGVVESTDPLVGQAVFASSDVVSVSFVWRKPESVLF